MSAAPPLAVFMYRDVLEAAIGQSDQCRVGLPQIIQEFSLVLDWTKFSMMRCVILMDFETTQSELIRCFGNVGSGPL